MKDILEIINSIPNAIWNIFLVADILIFTGQLMRFINKSFYSDCAFLRQEMIRHCIYMLLLGFIIVSKFYFVPVFIISNIVLGIIIFIVDIINILKKTRYCRIV